MSQGEVSRKSQVIVNRKGGRSVNADELFSSPRRS